MGTPRRPRTTRCGFWWERCFFFWVFCFFWCGIFFCLSGEPACFVFQGRCQEGRCWDVATGHGGTPGGSTPTQRKRKNKNKNFFSEVLSKKAPKKARKRDGCHQWGTNRGEKQRNTFGIGAPQGRGRVSWRRQAKKKSFKTVIGPWEKRLFNSRRGWWRIGLARFRLFLGGGGLYWGKKRAGAPGTTGERDGPTRNLSWTP